MKGVVFAGGNGTRLYPLTKAYSKQLVNVYDKPAIFYPIATLMEAGIREILIITTKENFNAYKNLLNDGSHLGVKIKYKIQKKANGCAAGLKLCKSFIKDDTFCVIMGDNLIYGKETIADIKKASESFSGAKIFCHEVENPSQYGVVKLKNGKIIQIEEKPKKPSSNLAIMGVYIYDKEVFKYINQISLSERNEFEIPDLNKIYLKNNTLNFKIVSNEEVWMDIGTAESLLEASCFVHDTQKKCNIEIACLEEIAYKKGYISIEQLKKMDIPQSEYGKHILSIRGKL